MKLVSLFPFRDDNVNILVQFLLFVSKTSLHIHMAKSFIDSKYSVGTNCVIYLLDFSPENF